METEFMARKLAGFKRYSYNNNGYLASLRNTNIFKTKIAIRDISILILTYLDQNERKMIISQSLVKYKVV